MSVPVSGLIIMAVTIWFLVTRPDDLIVLALVLNAFGAAAVVNIGGGFPVGIPPYYFVAALLTFRLIPRWVAGKVRFVAGEPSAAYARVMCLFVVVCVISAFLLPNLFEGLPVDVPRAGVTLHRQIPLAPLRWSLSNGGQAAYMILNFFVILEFLRRCNDEGFPAVLTKAFAWSGIIAAGVGFLQVACGQLGTKFPTWLFNSNTAWGQSPEQILTGGFKRMSATFVEPSEAGGFFACWMVFELTMATSPRRVEPLHWLNGTIATVALFLTTSTTGYVIAGVWWSVLLWQAALTLFRTGLIRMRKAAAVVFAVGGTMLVLLLVPGVWAMLNVVLFDKQQTDSAVDREATLGRAVYIFFETWGLGAGLGSNRAMSMALYVLSNLGVLGTILFVYLFVKPYFMARFAMRSPETSAGLGDFIRASGAALAANFVGMLVSGAEISASQMWLLLGMLLVGTRQGWLLKHGLLGIPSDEWSISQQKLGQIELL